MKENDDDWTWVTLGAIAFLSLCGALACSSVGNIPGALLVITLLAIYGAGGSAERAAVLVVIAIIVLKVYFAL